MTKLPRDADARRVIRALERLGFQVVHVSGSHSKMVREGETPRVAIVPFHGKLRTGTLRAILRAASLTVEEFLKAFVVM